MLEQVIKARLIAVDLAPGGTPRTPRMCLSVDKVAPVSIAAAAGIRRGDLLVEVDGKSAFKVNFGEMLDPHAHHHYRLFRPSSKEWRSVTATGAPLGMRLAQNTEALVDRAGWRDFAWDDLVTLWERQDWDALARAAGRIQSPPLWLQLVGMFVGGGTSREGSPASLMLAAAAYELGRPQDALPRIREYRVRWQKDWTVNFMAIAQYYFGLEAIRNGEQAKGLDDLMQAYETWPFERIAEKIEEITDRDFPRKSSPLENQPFPADYTFPYENGKGHINLAACLRELAREKLQVLCLLGSYRVNGPYIEFMTYFMRLVRHFPDHLAELHVVCESTTASKLANPDLKEESRNAIRSFLMEEERLRKEGIPFVVLHDEEGTLRAAVGSRGSPHVLVLNCKGIVLHDGEFDDVKFWELLGLVPARD